MAKEALEMLDSLVKERIPVESGIGMFTRNQHPIPSQPYSEKSITKERTTNIKLKKSIDIYQMN